MAATHGAGGGPRGGDGGTTRPPPRPPSCTAVRAGSPAWRIISPYVSRLNAEETPAAVWGGQVGTGAAVAVVGVATLLAPCRCVWVSDRRCWQGRWGVAPAGRGACGCLRSGHSGRWAPQGVYAGWLAAYRPVGCHSWGPGPWRDAGGIGGRGARGRECGHGGGGLPSTLLLSLLGGGEGGLADLGEVGRGANAWEREGAVCAQGADTLSGGAAGAGHCLGFVWCTLQHILSWFTKLSF